MQACTSMCKSARDTCTHSWRHACEHEAGARMLADVHASTRHAHGCSPMCMPASRRVHACSPTCMRARGTCTHARGGACQHEARARMLADVHVSTRQMHSCSRTCMSARGTCTHARGRACQHEARARMLTDVHARTRYVHACSTACRLARTRIDHVRRNLSKNTTEAIALATECL